MTKVLIETIIKSLIDALNIDLAEPIQSGLIVNKILINKRIKPSKKKAAYNQNQFTTFKDVDEKCVLTIQKTVDNKVKYSNVIVNRGIYEVYDVNEYIDFNRVPYILIKKVK